jgi:hypothetical protein
MKKPVKTAGIFLAIGLGIVLLIAGLGFFWLATSENLPVTNQDKNVIVRATDLIQYFDDFSPLEAHETFEKLKYLDGSVDLDYEYDSPNEDDPYITATVTHDNSKSDASATYMIEWSAMRLGLNIGDGDNDLVENNSFYSAGDESRFANMTYAGEPAGHLLVVRQGNSVYAFAIMGFLIEDSAMWRELFDERIAGLQRN